MQTMKEMAKQLATGVKPVVKVSRVLSSVFMSALLIISLFFSSHSYAQEGQQAPFFKGGVQGAPQASGLPAVVEHVGIDQMLGAQVNLSLPVRDENGNLTTLGAYFGNRPVVLVPAYYTCPHLCTMVMDGVIQGLKVLSFEPGKDYDVVTFSINPAEGPAVALKKKQSYMDTYHEQKYASSFHFLTAPESTIETLTKEIGFRYKYDSVNQQYAHAAGIMIVTPKGVVSRYFYGVEFAANDLKFGIMDASGGKVGTLADKILLYCCQYDPITSKYGFIVARALKIGGIAILLIMAGMFFWFHRYNRKKREQNLAILAGKGNS